MLQPTLPLDPVARRNSRSTKLLCDEFHVSLFFLYYGQLVLMLYISVSSYLGHIDPLQWNPYMEECLEFLSTNSECPGDDSLVCQVRLQLIANESDSARVTKTPAIFYVKTLITKVDRIKLESPSIQTDSKCC